MLSGPFAIYLANFAFVAYVHQLSQRRALLATSAEVESSRGITVRARTCSLLYGLGSDDPYVLNLIDTPGKE